MKKKTTSDSKEVIKKITEFAKEVSSSLLKHQSPKMEIPLRSLSNMSYDPKKGYLEMGDKAKTRTLNLNTVKTFAQSLRTMSIIKQLIESDDSATKREMYYIAKAWGEAKFDEQYESDSILSDIEGALRTTLEILRVAPEEKGGDVTGELEIIDKDPVTGKDIKINCTQFGSGAYSIPVAVDHLKFKTKAKFILAIETAGAAHRLNQYAYHKHANCILVSMGGVPTRACRRFIRRVSEDCNLPVLVFTDGDPYGYGNIYRTLKTGSANAGHLNEFFSVPWAKYVGVSASDIKKHNLPTHSLKEEDKKKIKDLLKNDPFFNHHKEWQKELNAMTKIGERVEQQALAAHGLEYVVEYLDQKIKNKDFLP